MLTPSKGKQFIGPLKHLSDKNIIP